MKKSIFLIPACVLLLTFAPLLRAQTPSPTPVQSGVPANKSPINEDSGDEDIVRINTTLVSVPVSVMDRNGRYVSRLRQEDFRIYEDGVEQQIANFSAVEKPFTIALLLDASGSTRLRFKDIQAAAIAFIDQLRPADRVIVISFGDRVQILTEATGNREVLRHAILQAASGNGTHVYDAVDFVINQRLNHRIPGRKAAILFTDGVDNVSRRATYASNLHDAEEAEALIYPVQYDTFAEETTVVTVPGIIGGRSPAEMVTKRTRVYPAGFGPKNYERAGVYLRELARKTGARYYHADDLKSLIAAFSRIAEELRWQYSLAYYPKTLSQSGQRRQLRVKVNRRNLTVRARRSYIYGSLGHATKPTVVEPGMLCSRLSEIKHLPFKNDLPIDDPVYQALVDAGEAALPCLIEKVADATPMKDPRGIPGPTDTRVGDVAYFVLVRIAKLDFIELLPGVVQKQYETEGVYAYHEFVSEQKHRLQLQAKLKAWHEQKYGVKK